MPDSIMTYEAMAQDLAPLESFDPEVFIGDSETPQAVCDFVLALALVFNDLRDVMACRIQLDEVSNHDEPLGPRLGLTNGLMASLLRIQAGVVHELLGLIKKNEELIHEKAFRGLIKKISREARTSWSTLVEVAVTGSGEEQLAKALLLIRNKVGFHYDQKEISRGYVSRFLNQEGGPPYISRGSNMAGTRFYFADAAAEEYVFSKGEGSVIDFLRSQYEFLDEIKVALYAIVTSFPATRGIAWQRVDLGT